MNQSTWPARVWPVQQAARPIARGAWSVASGMMVACGLAVSAQAQEKPAAGARPPAAPVVPGRPATPGSAPAAPLPDPTTEDPNTISLAAFAEPVQLSSLVDLLARTMNINLTVVGEVPGTVVFNAPVSIPKSEFLDLVDSLLEQQGYTITQDRTGFYSVRPVAQVAVNLTGELATTRVIATPNVRPSALSNAITQQLGAVSGGAGASGATARAISYVDELGIIVVTDTTRRLDAIQSLVNKILEEYGKSQFIRIDLQHVAAPVALQRVLQLVGQSSTRAPGAAGGVDPNAGQPAAAAGAKGALDNLGDRLTVDPQGNALVFRGVPEEIARVREALALIDKASELTPQRYEVGNAAKQVADLAQKRGLGEVTTIASDASRQNQFNQFQNFGFEGDPTAALRASRSASFAGGPVMVVDESRGSILYYGTAEQHTQMAELIVKLDAKSEAIVIREYKLNHSDAEKMAELINGLIRGETPASEQNPLLPGATPRPTVSPLPRMPGSMGEGVGEGLVIQGEHAFVIADKQNSQLLVRAPAKQQPEFAKLIEKLDLRRPQVYVEAKIVAVTADDRLRLAFEQQLINAQGTGGVLNTSFGLSAFGTGAFTDRKAVSTGLGGFTAAIIKSDQVPIVMTALANNTDSRVVANPQLLVDDNEEAEVVSLDRQPTSQISRGSSGQQDIVTAGDYAEAGTTLRVKPQISSGGYLRLKYDIELSSFTGDAQTIGTTTLPPPQQKNNIKSESITIPSNFTVVVGGIVVDTTSKTVAKIPLLGDIPILGHLFGDHRDRESQTVLYVFLTPRILRDPTFADLAALSEGPQKKVLLELESLRLTPSSIDLANAPARK